MSEKHTEIDRQIQDLTDEIRVQRMFLKSRPAIASDWENKVRSVVGIAAFGVDIAKAGQSLLRNTREEVPFLRRYSDTLQAVDRLFPLGIPLIEALAESGVKADK